MMPMGTRLWARLGPGHYGVSWGTQNSLTYWTRHVWTGYVVFSWGRGSGWSRR